MNWDDLRFLLAVSETGSLAQAAKRLEVDHRVLELLPGGGGRRGNGQCAAIGRRLGVMRLRVAGKGSSAEHEQAGSPAQGTTSEMLDFTNSKTSLACGPRGENVTQVTDQRLEFEGENRRGREG